MTTPSRRTRARPHTTVRRLLPYPLKVPPPNPATDGQPVAMGGAELLEYGPPAFLLGTVLVVILLKELGYLNIKY